jgi:MFS family permease
VLFTLVATFTYVTFHLAAPPYNLSTAALAWLFSVYLVGAAVTPIAGRWTDTRGHRAALGRAVSIGLTGGLFLLTPWLVTIMLGLALVATAVHARHREQAIGNVTDRDRGLAVGLCSTFTIWVAAPAAVPAVSGMWGMEATVGLVMAVQAGTFLVAMLSGTDRSRQIRPECPRPNVRDVHDRCGSGHGRGVGERGVRPASYEARHPPSPRPRGQS